MVNSEISLFANSDIYFNETISKVDDFLKSENSILCLSRWEESEDGSINITDNPHWSQDTWGIKKEQIKNIDFLNSLNIKIGTPRCDNKLAYKFTINGWDIHNPATKIISVHKHASNYRKYSIYEKVNLGGLAFPNINICPSSCSSIHLSIISQKTEKIQQDIKLNKMLETRNTERDCNIKRKFEVFDNGDFIAENNQHICGSFIVTEALKNISKDTAEKNISLVFNTWDAYTSSNKKEIDINQLKNKEWIGVEHLTGYMPDYYHTNYNNNLMIIPQFLEKLNKMELLSTCRGMLFTSTNSMKNYQNYEFLKGIKTGCAYHPIVKCTQSIEFNFLAYLKNKNKKLINFGWYNRNFAFFEKVKAPKFHKVFIFGGENTFKYNVYKDDLKYHGILESKTKVEKNKLHSSYLNRVLSENILFVNLYDASANNAILDAIERNTPILVNRIPASEEYLGVEYPLFYNNELEIENLLTDEKILEGHEYLACMDKTKFTIESFVNEINQFINTL